MKTRFVILLLVIPFWGFGQNASFDFIGSVDYTFRTLSSSEEAGELIIKSRKKEKGTLNWRAGFNYNQRITENLFIKTGLRFAVLGYTSEINFNNLVFASQFDPDLGFNPNLPPGINTENITIRYNHCLLEIPVVLRYEFSDKKFTPYVEAGFGGMYYLFYRYVSTQGDDRTVNVQYPGDDQLPVNTFQVESIIAVGANYKISKNLQLFGQPTFRYHLTPLWDTMLKERLWSVGLELGLRKYLK